MVVTTQTRLPDDRGRFGDFGGKFVPETVMAALTELEDSYRAVQDDAGFAEQLNHLMIDYAGRPTALYYAENLSRHCGGARIYLKREDLAHTGAHKINNALGQCLLAQRMGKRRIIAETGAGQHGVATATVCAMLGLQCIVYMGSEEAGPYGCRDGSIPACAGKPAPATRARRPRSEGSIPACAGKPRSVRSPPFRSPVEGPSPRVRGSPVAERDVAAAVLSVHPRVCGEASASRSRPDHCAWVHPRVCGEA